MWGKESFGSGEQTCSECSIKFIFPFIYLASTYYYYYGVVLQRKKKD
jgi:hypothetical protein